ncbi:MAG TPA: SGNH family hydrolase [Xanthobacteraceae bacterium]|nr:SGNH family hydrolase [Xanthobacteraceae bacterium]
MAVAIAAAGLALAGPAGAQFADTHAAFAALTRADRPRAEPVQFRDFFRMPFWSSGPSYPTPSNPYNPFYPRPQVLESTRPPPPRKVETPPTETIVVIGDSLADWLAYGLEETFADTPEIGVVRKIKPYAGLIRYEARPDAPDWSQAAKDALAAEKPSAVVVMLGVNDRLPLRERTPAPRPGGAAPAQGQGAAPQPQNPPPAAAAPEAAAPDGEQPAIAANETQRRPPGGAYEFHTDKWEELYIKRIDEMIAALKSKGAPVLWVGMPAIRGTRSTSDMSYLDELYRARAEKAGITYVDIWDGFVDEQGRYAVQGPDFEGQIRRLRTGDGVHFTKPGAVKLAHYVEHELRRVVTNHVVPVALPGPEEQSPAKGNARPAIGPVIPLSAVGNGERGDLLGASGHPAQHDSDPLATRVLGRGEAVAAPPGRADDFSWPRTDASAKAGPSGATDVAPPPPAMPAPPEPPAKGAGKADTSKTDTNKSNANKNDANKSESKRDTAPAAASPTAGAKPRQTRPNLEGAPPRPPLPLGPSANIHGGF